MVILAFSIGDVLSQYLWPVVQLVVGLGLVIFVHELGHFLGAKWADIKVERFSVGFGKPIWSYRRGETEYRIGILPLGGYVKMLGQDDVKPVMEEQPQPRSWQSTSVGKRLVVLAAGVAMNMVFAAILFIVVGLVGIRFPASVVGGVTRDYPAAKAEITWADGQAASSATQAAAPSAATRGLKPGDRIVKIDGKDVLRMARVRFKAMLAKPNEEFTMTFERDLNGRKRIGTASLGVKPVTSRPEGTSLVFGIAPAAGTVFGEDKKLLYDDPFRKGDRVLAVDGREIKHSWEIPLIEKTLDGGVVTVTVQRGSDRADIQVQPELAGGKLGDVIYVADGSRLYGRIIRRQEHEVTIRLEEGTEKEFDRRDVDTGRDELLDFLGLTPRLKIAAVEKGSPAGKAGLRPGDVIARYGDRGAPTFRRFLDINDKVVGTDTDIVVIRDGKTLPPIQIAPVKHKDRVLVGVLQGSDLAHTVVAGVRPGSPAAAAGVRSGDVIEKINSRGVNSWIDVFQTLRGLIGKEVTLTWRHGTGRETASLGKLTKEVFDPEDYEFTVFAGPRPLQQLTVRIVKANPLAAIAWGAEESAFFIAMTYGALRAWLTRTISGRQFSGPVGIVGAGVQVARQSLIKLIYLMAVIGVTIAVINFLPLPLLDGGLVVLVLIEKIRGRPLPLKVQAAIQIVGLVMIAGVFVAVTWSDISKLIWRSW